MSIQVLSAGNAAPLVSQSRKGAKARCTNAQQAGKEPTHPLAAPPRGLASHNGASRRQAVAAGLCAAASVWLPCAAAAAAPAQPRESDAAPSAEERAYDTYADSYDTLDDGWVAERLGIPGLRRRLLASAHGMVLEVGVGTGLNLPLYSRAAVTNLTGVDLSAGMLAQAAARVRDMGASDWIRLQKGNVMALPFGDAQFDYVVDTFSLCVYSRPAAALAEMARVVKPGGRVLLLEHARSNNPLLGWYQSATSAAVAAGGKGCVWDQDVASLTSQAGLVAVRQEEALGGVLRVIEARRD